MHEITLLINIVVALVVAFIGGVIARRIGLPTIVGYLLAGIVIGPFTPGFVGDTETISQKQLDDIQSQFEQKMRQGFFAADVTDGRNVLINKFDPKANILLIPRVRGGY